jgi:hypothetical protein
MRFAIIPVLLAAGLVACAPTSAPIGNRDSGIVAWDRSARTLWLGPESYLVPDGVSTNGMMAGDTVTVTWQEQGGQRVASRVTVDRRRADDERP